MKKLHKILDTTVRTQVLMCLFTISIFILIIPYNATKEIEDNIVIYYPLKKGYTWHYIEKEYLDGGVITRKIIHRIENEEMRDKVILSSERATR